MGQIGLNTGHNFSEYFLPILTLVGMPFTFAHPAIVLPLNYLPKTWISLTALVIGAITPDFEYFLRLETVSYYSHGTPGVFWFDLPLGLLVYIIYQLLVKNVLIDHLPSFLHNRLYIYKNNKGAIITLKSISVILVCLFIGIASHLFWDSFTHRNRFFVLRIPFLTDTFDIAGNRIVGFKLMQQLSTLIGLAIIGSTIKRLPAAGQFKTKGIWRFWAFVIGCMLIAVTIRLCTGLNLNTRNNELALAALVATAISGASMGLIIASFYSKVKAQKRPRKRSLSNISL